MSKRRSMNVYFIVWLNVNSSKLESLELSLVDKMTVYSLQHLIDVLCTSWTSHERSFSEIMWLNYRQFLIKTSLVIISYRRLMYVMDVP